MPSTARPTPRRVVAGGAAIVAALYVLIGFSVITVADGQAGETVPPLLIAGVLFAVLAAAVLLTRSRAVLWLGAALQLMVIAGYFAIAPDRTPAFEVWGLGLKALQVGLLAGLILLAIRCPMTTREPGTATAPRHI